MPILTDQKLLRLLKYFPIAIVALFIMVLAGVMLHGHQVKVDSLIQSLRNDAYNNQKSVLAEQVFNINSQLEYERFQTVEVLKKNIQQRVEEAHAIATNIYLENQDKPQAYVTKLISDALRTIRFNDGRGYFFVFQMDGVSVMHGLLPHIEGQSKWGAQDVRGTFILREHIQLIEKSGDAFYRWWYKRPNSGEREFEKIGYGKHFEPYDWFIGTGEYVVDVEQDIQTRILKRLSEYTFGANGYVFVIGDKGTNLAHHDRAQLGVDNSDLLALVEQDKANSVLTDNGMQGNYVEYPSLYPFEGELHPDVLSFVTPFEPWGWHIGAGVYLSKLEAYLAHQEQIQNQQNQSELIKILLLCLVLALILGFISLRISYYIGLRFSEYQDRILEDIQKLKNSREKMHELATHDVLTQLPNRLLLEDIIETSIQQTKCANAKLAVMFVDMDDFKKVNDQYGHTVGDLLLQEVSQKFKSLLSCQDSVARFGGDEFIFCFPLLKDINEAKYKAKTIREVFNDSFILDNVFLSCTCSIGVAMYPDDGASAEELISKSDIVLYRSKEKHKGQVMFYDNQVNELVQRSFLMQDELNGALDNEELTVYYQPQVKPDSAEMVSVEALCRWQNPKLGSVPPIQFIEVAEKTGLVIEIGEYVFVQACRDIVALSPNGPDALELSINISPLQLTRTDFSERVYSLATETGIDVNRVTLEITENVLIEDLDKVKPTLIKLRELGFGISLDDFGTGYSSLQYLNTLPITELKIDRSFISHLFEDLQQDLLVQTMVRIGKSFNMIVVAEGVETVQQRERLSDLQCDRLQGYLFDKALDIRDLRSRYQKPELAAVK